MVMTNRALADRYADLDAQIKALESEKDKLKSEIIDSGRELIDGDEYQIKVYLSQRPVLDEFELKKRYGVTPEQLKLYNACKKEGKPFSVLKIINKQENRDDR